jgi:hypothetical protein
MELYVHPPPISFNGVVLNLLSTSTTLLLSKIRTISLKNTELTNPYLRVEAVLAIKDDDYCLLGCDAV